MSVTAPAGFQAAGVACGLKPAGALDLALVAVAPDGDGRRHPVPAAATFTLNRAAAGPVQVSRGHLAATGGRAAAIVLNSGNANAATGSRGLADAEQATGSVARLLGVAAEAVLVCSTGLIGIPLPDGVIPAGVPALVGALGEGPAAGTTAARAIMTTDTRPKEMMVEGRGFRVGAMAKGAAMLAPDMATMLAVLTTDAETDPAGLAQALRAAVAGSFNELSVDGCCSTNDTVVVMASGRCGRPVAAGELEPALSEACAGLAAQMAADAEGGTKVVRVRVTGAASGADARRGARRVAESQLVQCSVHGADPYWGRVVSELGSAGIAFDPDRVSVAYGGVAVCRDGVAADHDGAAVARHLGGHDVEVSADLGLGSGSAAVLTSDLSPAYIAENMRTS